MKRSLPVLCFLMVLVTLAIGQGEDTVHQYLKEADLNFYTETPDSKNDSLALFNYQKVIGHSSFNEVFDTAIKVGIFENTGVLLLEQNKNDEAISIFRKSLELQHNIQDTIFFASNLFLGEAYYSISKLDSAAAFLNIAEDIFEYKNSKLEASRLYNSLGVIYYEMGNFFQAINYFTKADDLVEQETGGDLDNPYYLYAHHSFLNNIASSMMKTNQLDTAVHVFKSLLPLDVNNDVIYLHLADIFIEKELPDSAGYYLDQISNIEIYQNIGFINQQAEVFILKDSLNSAKELLNQAIENIQREYRDFNVAGKDFRIGTSHYLLGKIFMEEKKLDQALDHFHTSLMHFDPSFNDPDFFINPDQREISFAAFTMFKSYIKKAEALAEIAKQKNDQQYWDAAFETFESAFNRVKYLSAIYDNDEARIFLGDFVIDAYNIAVEYAYCKYISDNNVEYLKKAFFFAESSKSIGLLIGNAESRFKTSIGLPTELLEKERNLNFRYSSILVKLNNENDITTIDELQKELLDIKLELSRLHDDFNQSEQFVDIKFAESEIDLDNIQKNILLKNTGLISYYVADRILYTFFVDKNTIQAFVNPLPKNLDTSIDAFNSQVFNSSLGEKFNNSTENQILYSLLLGFEKTNSLDHLILIPHASLNDIPFEVLKNEENKFLVENFAISYMFSSKFLKSNDFERSDFHKILSMAPFAVQDELIVKSNFTDLPSTLSEVQQLQGTSKIGSGATKAFFLQHFNQYPILHLATHAEVNLADIGRSFVAFYPDEIDHKLYLDEIMRANIEIGKFVFLSSCESNAGQISNSEGILGLSRAFAYAGYPNMITTKWKTSDQVSEYISKAFYENVNQGKSFSQALQLAKIQLLSDPIMVQYRHPKYWAPFIYIGSPAKLAQPNWLIAAMIISFILGILLLLYKKNYLKKLR
ncbi:CHAT domain-containing protein [Aquiflexum lacus]|uniref:CHAT domain-containing protein n=1 Tax=Aquiflexum lacus TaxID=2483805 RepID=UPI001894DC3D|nr:CHAT domain-containing protein [Aquiflexum lacus]